MGLMVFLHDETGQSMVESGVLIGAIALFCVVALVVIGKKVVDMFQSVSDNLPDGLTTPTLH